MEAIELPKFDTEEYEGRKQRAKHSGDYNSIIERLVDDANRARSVEEAFDPETGLPRLPEGQSPHPDGVPGLPPYRIVQGASDSDMEEEDVVEERSAEEELNPTIPEDASPKTVYSAPAVHHKIKKDKIDMKIDDFLKEI